MKKVRIAVLAYSGCMATQLFGIADVLRIAGNLDARMGARRGVSLQVETVGLAGRIVTLAGGLEVRPKRPAGQYDLLVVPGLEPTRDRDWALALTELAPQCRFLQQCFARGTTVASICTGAFVLGEAGLLNGHNVTTAWLFAADLAARYPEARVNAEAIVLQDGAIITTAAVSSAFDLAIHLIKLYLGAEVATATAAVTLLSAPRTSQSPYVDAALIATEQPTFARNLLRWFESRLTEEYDLDRVAQAFHVSSRTLIRRVKADTGKSPLALLQEARIEQAKRLLHGCDWPIVRIVEAVGYADVVSFSRLFARSVGETPAKYRRRRA
jgi:transcriptional regulator GlxA family with amidase domain